MYPCIETSCLILIDFLIWAQTCHILIFPSKGTYCTIVKYITDNASAIIFVSIRALMITSSCAGLKVKIGQQPKPYLCEGANSVVTLFAAESLQDLVPDSESHSYECLCIKIALTFELLWTGIISLPCFPLHFLLSYLKSHFQKFLCINSGQ